jgi:hypothetical protein
MLSRTNERDKKEIMGMIVPLTPAKYYPVVNDEVVQGLWFEPTFSKRTARSDCREQSAFLASDRGLTRKIPQTKSEKASCCAAKRRGYIRTSSCTLLVEKN